MKFLRKKEMLTAVVFLLIIIVMAAEMVKVNISGESLISKYRAKAGADAAALTRVEAAIATAEEAVQSGGRIQGAFIETYGLFNRLIGRHSVTDSYYGNLYKLDDGQLAFRVYQSDTSAHAMSVYNLVNQLKAEDIDFTYIQLPFKLAPEKYTQFSDIPASDSDYSNENADAFLEYMDAGGVSYYDTRDEFWSSGMSRNELFFKTDHHWSIEGAFYTTGLIAEYLNENYQFGIPEGLYSGENFDFDVRKNDFIGSLGRRTGRIFGGIDDFAVVTPKFETDMRLEQYDYQNDAVFEGSFEEAVLDKKYLEPEDPETNRYCAYHGDMAELRFTNNLAQNDSKVLIIKDSFGIPVYSFLSTGIKEVRAVDLRLFKQNIVEYAKTYDPDLVILMYNADCFSGDVMFNFNLDK